MKLLLLSAFASGALVAGLQAGRIYDTAMSYSESCDRAPLPNAYGRYEAKGVACHLADYIVYGDALQQPVTACLLARTVPTDANIEACTGQPI